MLWTDFVLGRWLRRRPATSGVYAMRPIGGVAFVNRFDAHPPGWTPAQLECAVLHGGASRELEFPYIDGDELGRPTRADEPRAHAIAKAKAKANGCCSDADPEPKGRTAR